MHAPDKKNKYKGPEPGACLMNQEKARKPVWLERVSSEEIILIRSE